MARRFFTTPTAPGLAPIGTLIPYAGSGDPAEGAWLLADGRLVDRTVYAAFYALVGHAYNGGVDPGSNMVRLPDKRGRASVGADNMGTAQGAASRIPNSNRTRGQSGGEERHTLTQGELVGHQHNMPLMHSGGLGAISGADRAARMQGGTIDAASFYTTAGGSSTAFTGAVPATPLNVMQPYEIDSWLVRVL